MVTVSQAEEIILAQMPDYAPAALGFDPAHGRILAEDILADRDLPACNRVTMDGIAIRYSTLAAGIRTYRVVATMAAGDEPVTITQQDDCAELMTGAALPPGTDTVVRYEDVELSSGMATLAAGAIIREGQNIHRKGTDRVAGDVVVRAGQRIDAAVISMAASVGKEQLQVRGLPRVVIITTGNELVDAASQPTPYQVRASNSHTLRAVLQQHGIDAHIQHLPDSETALQSGLKDCLSHYDVILMSGGVSMGRYDYVPQVLAGLGVQQLFHKVQQRPGKPFWFGREAGGGTLVFAFPGNPVSAFMCLHRYFIPWLCAAAGILRQPCFAMLAQQVTFAPPLQYFMQVQVTVNHSGQLMAIPIQGNGSGDFANLVDSNAFMELPLEKSEFKQGEIYPVWPYKPIV